MTQEGPALPGLRYLDKLGSGGFSHVYLYERDHPRQKVAVKLLQSGDLDAWQLQQFRDEADLMAELAEHPFIVPVLGAGTAPDGRPYLMMRYYPPPDLGARVARQQLTVPEALRTGIQLAGAVETAHRSGIIHRDIKPANILVTSYGAPGLSDFGIAGRGQRTSEEEYVGVSVPWSPPEVLQGYSNGSAASDIYSLAATIWHLLVGRPPFAVQGDNGYRAHSHRIATLPPPPTGRAAVPASLDRLLQQAMAKNPAHRPASAIEFGRLLQRVEQELRLARTEIVVLDGGAGPSAASAGPAPAAFVDADVTILKRSGSTHGGRHEPEGESTERRSTPSGPPPSTSGPRLTRVSPEPPPAPPDDHSPSKFPTALAIVAAVALLVAAVVVGVTLTGDDDEPPPTSGGQPDPSSADDVLPGLPALTEPELTAKTTANGIKFTASGADDGTSYSWQVSVARGPFEPFAAAATARSITVSKARGGVCAELMISKDGRTAGPYQVCQDEP